MNDESLVKIPPASAEQQAIVDAIHRDQCHVIVNSVAGSGKTTASLHIATANPSKQVLLLTYNSRLKEETRVRVAMSLIRNMEVHSYHAFGFKYYSDRCQCDTGLRQLIEEDLQPLRPLPNYDIIIVDEAQDMRRLFFGLLCKLIRDLRTQHYSSPAVEAAAERERGERGERGEGGGGVMARMPRHYSLNGQHQQQLQLQEQQQQRHYKEPQLVIIGDENQCIYRFMGADPRFLTLADELQRGVRERDTQESLGLHGSIDTNPDGNVGEKGERRRGREWRRLHLKTSYRVTGNIAAFVNEAMLGRNHMLAHKERGAQVHYCQGKPYKTVIAIAKEITELIRTKQAQPSDFFVLAGSVQSVKQTPLRVLENMLVEREIGVFVSKSDMGSDTKKEVADNKVIFTSFHQAKGLERRYVIVLGFDASYFHFYGQSLPTRLVCPNTLYVAATRALEVLCLVAEEHPEGALPFLNGDFMRNVMTKPGPKGEPPTVVLQRLNEYTEPGFFHRTYTGASYLPELPSIGPVGVEIVQDKSPQLIVTDLLKFVTEPVMSKALECLQPIVHIPLVDPPKSCSFSVNSSTYCTPPSPSEQHDQEEEQEEEEIEEEKRGRDCAVGARRSRAELNTRTTTPIGAQSKRQRTYFPSGSGANAEYSHQKEQFFTQSVVEKEAEAEKDETMPVKLYPLHKQVLKQLQLNAARCSKNNNSNKNNRNKNNNSNNSVVGGGSGGGMDDVCDFRVLKLPHTVLGVRGLKQQVSELNGLAIPAMLEVEVHRLHAASIALSTTTSSSSRGGGSGGGNYMREGREGSSNMERTGVEEETATAVATFTAAPVEAAAAAAVGREGGINIIEGTSGEGECRRRVGVGAGVLRSPVTIAPRSLAAEPGPTPAPATTTGSVGVLSSPLPLSHPYAPYTTQNNKSNNNKNNNDNKNYSSTSITVNRGTAAATAAVGDKEEDFDFEVTGPTNHQLSTSAKPKLEREHERKLEEVKPAAEISCAMYDALIESCRDPELHATVKSRFLLLPPPCNMFSPAHFLELAAVYQAGAGHSSRGYISNLLQLEKFDWISASLRDASMAVLRAAVRDCRNVEDGAPTARFEVPVSEYFLWEYGDTSHGEKRPEIAGKCEKDERGDRAIEEDVQREEQQEHDHRELHRKEQQEQVMNWLLSRPDEEGELLQQQQQQQQQPQLLQQCHHQQQQHLQYHQQQAQQAQIPPQQPQQSQADQEESGVAVQLQGIMDIVTQTTVWEVKCVSALQDAHFVQLGLYAWLWRRTHEVIEGPRRFRIVNVSTSEVWEISTKRLDDMAQILLQHHFRAQRTTTREEFLVDAVAAGAKSASFLVQKDDQKLFDFRQRELSEREERRLARQEGERISALQEMMHMLRLDQTVGFPGQPRSESLPIRPCEENGASLENQVEKLGKWANDGEEKDKFQPEYGFLPTVEKMRKQRLQLRNLQLQQQLQQLQASMREEEEEEEKEEDNEQTISRAALRFNLICDLAEV